MSNAVHAVSAIDDAIREYLLFRGFTHTLRAFEGEIKTDRDRSLRVDKIVNQLFMYLVSADLASLCEFWDHLGRRFFSRLEKCFGSSVRKLELCLKRYYVVHAIQNGRHDKVQEFFEMLAPELQTQMEWRDWFALPFLKNPESHPAYETFFSRAWLETFTLSLHNFLNTMFSNLPLPTLLSFDDEQIKLRAMTDEIESLRAAAWAGSKQLSDGDGPRAQYSDAADAGNGGDQAGPGSHGHGRREPVPPPYDETGTPRRARTPTTSESDKSTPGATATPAADGVMGQGTANVDAALTSSPDKGAGLPGLLGGDEASRHASASSVVVPADDVTANEQPSTTFSKEVFIMLNQERYTEHQAPIVMCNVSALGSFVASVDADHVLKIWSTTPVLKTKATLPAGSTLSCIAWDQQSDRNLFIGYTDGRVCRMDVETQATTTVELPDTHPTVVAMACKGLVLACALTDDGGAEATGGLVLMDSKTLAVQAELPMPNKQSIGCSFHFNHNTTLLVVGCIDGIVQIYDVRTSNFIMGWPAHKTKLCHAKFSHDETTVFSSSTDGKLMRWNAHQLVLPITQPMERPGNLEYIGDFPRALDFAFDTDDEYVLRNNSPANVDEPGEACIFQLRHDQKSPQQSPAVLKLQGHEKGVSCIDWCASSNTCFTGSEDGTIFVYTLFKVT